MFSLISLVFSNARRVLSQCNKLTLLYLLNKKVIIIIIIIIIIINLNNFQCIFTGKNVAKVFTLGGGVGDFRNRHNVDFFFLKKVSCLHFVLHLHCGYCSNSSNMELQSLIMFGWKPAPLADLKMLRRGYTWRRFGRRLTRPFCQYLSHVLSDAKSLCLSH